MAYRRVPEHPYALRAVAVTVFRKLLHLCDVSEPQGPPSDTIGDYVWISH